MKTFKSSCSRPTVHGHPPRERCPSAASAAPLLLEGSSGSRSRSKGAPWAVCGAPQLLPPRRRDRGARPAACREPRRVLREHGESGTRPRVPRGREEDVKRQLASCRGEEGGKAKPSCGSSPALVAAAGPSCVPGSGQGPPGDTLGTPGGAVSSCQEPGGWLRTARERPRSREQGQQHAGTGTNSKMRTRNHRHPLKSAASPEALSAPEPPGCPQPGHGPGLQRRGTQAEPRGAARSSSSALHERSPRELQKLCARSSHTGPT